MSEVLSLPTQELASLSRMSGDERAKRLLAMPREERMAYFAIDAMREPNPVHDLSGDRPGSSQPPLTPEEIEQRARHDAEMAVAISQQPGAEAPEYYIAGNWDRCVRERALELLPEISGQWMLLEPAE